VGDFDELQGHDPQAEDDVAAKADKAEAKADKVEAAAEEKKSPPASHGGESKSHH